MTHRVITEPLGGSALSRALQEGRVSGVGDGLAPSSVEGWRAHVQRVGSSARADWLASLRPALAPSGAAAERLDRVARAGGVVVTTGQQAALFGGPLYTIAKAISALALADAIEAHLGVPAAPVFWSATDDADFAEAATTFAADAEGLHELTITSRPAAGTTMSIMALRGMDSLAATLRRVSGSASHPEFLAATEASFRDGHTLGDAYTTLLRSLLEPLGIGVMDSSHPAYRDAARPVLRDALRESRGVADRVARMSAAIAAAGFEPQVQDDRGLSLVFAIDAGMKRRIAVTDAAASMGLTSLAPNVLLRPVVERAIFPTVAYVAGPGELAYFAQSAAVADALGRDRPMGVPRWSCTIVEPFAARALQRLAIEHHELQDMHALEARFARRSLPDGVAVPLQQLRATVAAQLRALRAGNRDSGLVPDAVMEGLERGLEHRLGRAERRLLAGVKRRDDQVRRDLAVAGAALFPKGKRQERVLNFIPMLARGGRPLLETMRQQAATHADVVLARSGERQPAAG